MFSPQHVRLLSSCYPAAPIAASPGFKPNGQELSRLTYFGSNKPSKLAKVGAELEKRAQNESRKASTGHQKSRALLLVTLEILRTLCAECRQDISLFARSVVVSIDYALSALPNDLEIAARSASVFTAFTTFTDGKANAMDEFLTKSYLSVISKFAAISQWTKDKDEEMRARFRLVGLAALTAAIGSDALYSSLESSKAQVVIIVPALLRNAQEAGLKLLQEQEALVESTQATSPYFSEFQPQRPVAQRRAASIHAHQDGVDGPSMADVSFGALRATKNLLGRSDGPQISGFLTALFSMLDSTNTWSDTDLCCWLALNITEWTQYQHRYAIPIRLVEKLIDTPDNNDTAHCHHTLLAMVTAVFSSKTLIANLATSDVMSSLIGFILRRAELNPSDPILPSIVNCVSSLATHLYYGDQIQDFVEEIIHRLSEVQGREISFDTPNRREGMRCLISCLSGLINVASKHAHHQHSPRSSDEKQNEQAGSSGPTSPVDGNGKARRGSSVASAGGRRNLISPEIWSETLVILCEADYGVRSDYARTLSLFVRSEIAKEPSLHGEDSPTVIRGKPVVDISGSDETIRFLHALNATLYTLAVAPSLGLGFGSMSSGRHADVPESSSRATSSVADDSSVYTSAQGTIQLNLIDSTPVQTPKTETYERNYPEPTVSWGLSNGSLNKRGSTRSRTASLALSLIEPTEGNLGLASGPTATPNDYSHIVAIISSAIMRSPARAITTGVPMLISLDKISSVALPSSDIMLRARRQAIREVLAQIWAVIGSVLQSVEIQKQAEQALASLPHPSVLPVITELRDTFSQPAEQPQTFASNGAAYNTLLPADALPPLIDSEVVLLAIASSSGLRQVTLLDRQGLLRQLAVQWSPGAALSDSIEKFTIDMNGGRQEGSLPFLKLAPALMHIDNKSLQSLARSTRNVGVGDLREALEGRASANRSSVGLGYNPSLSSIGHSSALDADGLSGHVQARLRLASTVREANGEVKEILNKLGIGKQNSSRVKSKGVFKSPLPPKRGNSNSSGP